MCYECGEERWLPIPEWPGYEHSNYGRTRNRHGRILKPRPCTSKSGVWYYRVYLSCKGVSRDMSCARLTLTLFSGPCPDGHEACHGKRGSLVNCITNLSWGTRSKNMGPDRYRDGTQVIGGRNGSSVLTEKDVSEIVTLINDGKSNVNIAKKFGVTDVTIAYIRRGKKWAWLTGISPSKGIRGKTTCAKYSSSQEGG